MRLTAERTEVSPERVRDVAASLAARGLVEIDGDAVLATPVGDAVAESVGEAERRRLRQWVAEWPGGDEPEVEQLVEQLTHQLLADDTDVVEHR